MERSDRHDVLFTGMLLVTTAHALTRSEVREEPVCSVMAAGWFLGKVQLNWGSGGCETGGF